jgi:glycosyltransferase involved in cell wall biosynthesis
MAVYYGDDPEFVRSALDSVLEQTVPPQEIVIVADGPLPTALSTVLSEATSAHPKTVRVESLETNQGLGMALQIGVEACSHDLVARMDADDIALPDRFEKQLDYLAANPQVDVLGGYVAEFETDPESVESVRTVPTDPDTARSRAPFRCPLNHPTVMFRREAVLEAGNYSSLRSMQDYELWVRMVTQGYTIDNLPEVLVHCRTGEELYTRRGGLSYARIEVGLQRQFLQMGAISVPEFVFNICTRIPVRIAPRRVRGFVYQRLLRNEVLPS